MVSRLPFDQWAPGEIKRLRQQADALQAALDLYREAPRENPVDAERPRSSRRVILKSKYEPLFRAFADTNKVLTLDEMFQKSQELGFQLDRNNLRSQVFAQKQAGRTRLEGNGYKWELSNSQAAPSLDEDAA